MGHQTYHITAYQPRLLAAYIDHFQIFHFNEDSIIHLFPEGRFDLILQSDRDILFQSAEAPDWISRPKQFIGGLHNRSFALKPIKKNTRLVSIRFKADCAKYFIPDRLDVYKNKIIDLQDVFPAVQWKYLESINLGDSPIQIVQQLESFLKDIFQKKDKSPIDASVEFLQQQNGFLRIDKLAEKACLSTAQFRKRFREEIGMSPKEYSKIIRINTVARLLKENTSFERLTDLAYHLGYFDQSHFIKDFQAIMGTSPKKYLSAISSKATIHS